MTTATIEQTEKYSRMQWDSRSEDYTGRVEVDGMTFDIKVGGDCFIEGRRDLVYQAYAEFLGVDEDDVDWGGEAEETDEYGAIQDRIDTELLNAHEWAELDIEGNTMRTGVQMFRVGTLVIQPEGTEAIVEAIVADLSDTSGYPNYQWTDGKTVAGGDNGGSPFPASVIAARCVDLIRDIRDENNNWGAFVETSYDEDFYPTVHVNMDEVRAALPPTFEVE